MLKRIINKVELWVVVLMAFIVFFACNGGEGNSVDVNEHSAIIGGINSNNNNGTLYDGRDGKTYKTVKIGSQIWMAENLNYKTEGSRCYNDDSANCIKYGRLYLWDDAMQACPSGWHLPSKEEYITLIEFIGGVVNSAQYLYAGKILKAKTEWNNTAFCNCSGTDDYGFSMLPGGSFEAKYEEPYRGLGREALVWTSSHDEHFFFLIGFDDRNDYAEEGIGTSKESLSVRCVRD